MKKNGFIASALLYGMLALFLTLMLSTLYIMANNKLSMDKLKQKALEKVGTDVPTEQPTSTLEFDIRYRPGYYEYRTDASQVNQSMLTQSPTTLNKLYYLGYDIENELVKSRYVCFIIDNIQYCMKGTTDSSSAETNISILKQLNQEGKITCSTLTDNSATCGGNEIGYLYVGIDGVVSAGENSSAKCSAQQGISSCND